MRNPIIYLSLILSLLLIGAVLKDMSDTKVTNSDIIGTWIMEGDNKAKIIVNEKYIQVIALPEYVFGTSDGKCRTSLSGSYSLAEGYRTHHELMITGTESDTAGLGYYRIRLFVGRMDGDIRIFSILGDPDSGNYVLFTKVPR